ncbi:MAG: tetratricopeptide repeat protein [Ignavibacteriaceae bacterium]|nr:tetratricopeptide repeat protein [Ignavibacteriaceae bacterium]NUM71034.1 tetratricopeptide repeat protein [Ignavibacteriaceae bacterium]
MSKLHKKEMREDKLVTLWYEGLAVVDKFRKQFIIGAIAFVVVVASVVGYTFYNKSQNEKAAALLSKVTPVYDSGAYLDAIEGRPNQQIIGLKKLVADFGGTNEGETAKILLANSYYFLGKIDEALKAYEDYSGDVDLLQAASYAGAAGCYEAKNELEKAAELYIKAAGVSKNVPQNPQYLLFAGINYVELNQKDKAKELFNQIKTEYSKSMVVRDLDRYMAMVE